MNKQDLITALADNVGITKKQADAAITTLGDAVTNVLASGGEVTLPGLGKLSVKTRAARKGRNPATGAEMDIPAKTKPHFSAAKALKDAVAG